VHELSELYDAEHRFLEEQAVMVNKATDHELQKAIENHIYQTRQHIRNLEQFFRELGQEPRREANEVAQRLVSKARQDIQETQDDALRDCAINAAVTKVEHFEMASYRALIAGAQLMMGQSMVMNLLNENLGQEEETARTAEQSAEELFRKALRAEAPEREGPIALVANLMAKTSDKLRSTEKDESKSSEGEGEKALLVEKAEEVANKLRSPEKKRTGKKPAVDKGVGEPGVKKGQS
jgi:ferritin-like metal-binding protein YciE